MTLTGERTAGEHAPTCLPSRFRSDPERTLRLGKMLRRVAKVEQVDEELMERLGAGLMTHDPVGHKLAVAMREATPGQPKVSMKDLGRLLEKGPDDSTHPALVEFWEAVTPEPEWVDWDLLRKGQRVYRRWGRNSIDALLVLSLMAGYRFGGPTELLVATGGLTGQAARRRMAETQLWTTEIAEPDSLRRFGRAWQLTLHVRAMHALVNYTFLNNGRWDVEKWGVPISTTDQGGTLGVFDAAPMLGVRAMGVPVSQADSDAVMHVWKYVGWLMGVDPAFLVDSEQERLKLAYHILLCQAPQTEAGISLTTDLLNLQQETYSGRFATLRGRYQRERILSLMTLFLGRESMRELRLPRRLPWAFLNAHVRNFLRYRVLFKLPGGTARMDRYGDQIVVDLHDRYFGQEERGVAPMQGELHLGNANPSATDCPDRV